MSQLIRKSLGVFALVAAAAVAAPLRVAAQAPATAQSARSHKRPVVKRPVPIAGQHGAAPFVRTELYFGSARADQAPVSEEEFHAFLDAEITPRFPDGLTLLTGSGQFTGEDGVLVKEQSFVLLLFYPVDTLKESSRKIEEIRKLYLDQFDQESVLRLDDPLTVWVSF
jgi:hypothetical protein